MLAEPRRNTAAVRCQESSPRESATAPRVAFRRSGTRGGNFPGTVRTPAILMPLASLGNGLELYYEVHGEGPPVLLLMGTGADHTFWTPQIGPYSERFQLIVIDARGTGRSSRPRNYLQTTMRTMAEDAARLL